MCTLEELHLKRKLYVALIKILSDAMFEIQNILQPLGLDNDELVFHPVESLYVCQFCHNED